MIVCIAVLIGLRATLVQPMPLVRYRHMLLIDDGRKDAGTSPSLLLVLPTNPAFDRGFQLTSLTDFFLLNPRLKPK
jgi:hypothetical protein